MKTRLIDRKKGNSEYKCEEDIILNFVSL